MRRSQHNGWKLGFMSMDVGREESMHRGRKFEYFPPWWMKLNEEAAMADRKPRDELTVEAGLASFTSPRKREGS